MIEILSKNRDYLTFVKIPMKNYKSIILNDEVLMYFCDGRKKLFEKEKRQPWLPRLLADLALTGKALLLLPQ